MTSNYSYEDIVSDRDSLRSEDINSVESDGSVDENCYSDQI